MPVPVSTSKRPTETRGELSARPKTTRARGSAADASQQQHHPDRDPELEDLEFEDAWEDEYESEDSFVDEAQQEGNEDGDSSVKLNGDDAVTRKAYIPGKELAEGEELEVDPSAYDMLHALGMQWPSLSFDILPDNLGDSRTQFPHSMYLVTGTQAASAHQNEITLMSLSDLSKTKKDMVESDSESDSDEDEGDPVLIVRRIRHRAGINRIRAMRTPRDQPTTIVATWADDATVRLYNLTDAYSALKKNQTITKVTEQAPMFQVRAHRVEGFALDWSRVESGMLASGDCDGHILVTRPHQSSFQTDSQYYEGHQGSVEDIQWSPNEATVFLSCGCDGYVRFWDTRMNRKPAISLRVSNVDCNVCSWSPLSQYLLATGHDDGSFAVWDMREVAKGARQDQREIAGLSSVASFTWHKKAITSLEWHPKDDSMLATSSSDDTLVVWDLATEVDNDVMTDDHDETPNVPGQLMFIHQGQRDIKELHWHPQIPGCMVSTASDGFNVFKTINS